MTDPRMELYLKVREQILSMQEAGQPVPEAIKRRDRREPDGVNKERLEDRMYAEVRRHWARQTKKFQELSGRYLPSREKADIPMIPWDDLLDDDEFDAAMLRLVLIGITQGIQLFANTINIGLDYTLINKWALEFARGYVFELVKGIDATTVKLLQTAVASFVETPGFTIGDLMNMIKDTFGQPRARMIAVTETTRAYAEGQLAAGRELQQKWPDVRVTKTWFTNNDDRVCTICGPLNGTEVNLQENFVVVADGKTLWEGPAMPAHPNCRCWLGTGTRING